MNYSKFYTDYVSPEFGSLTDSLKDMLKNPLKHKRAGSKSETSPIELNARLLAFCKDEGLEAKKLYHEFDHILADLALTKLYYNDDGLVDLKATWAGLSYEDRGKLMVTLCSRSTTSSQSTAKQKYGVLVPMFFAAHKKYNNVPYSKFITQYNIPYFSLFLEFKVAMMLQFFLVKGVTDYPIPSSDIHERRVGAFNGYDPRASNHVVYYPVKAGFDILTPQIAIHIMLQTWAASPNYWVEHEISEKYALLNPLDWDTAPEPQWSELQKPKIEVASNETPSKKLKENWDTPW